MNKLAFPVLLFLATAGFGFGIMQFFSASDAATENAALLRKLSDTEQKNKQSLDKANRELALVTENITRLENERDAAKQKTKKPEGGLAADASVTTEGAVPANASTGGRGQGVRGMLQNWAQQMDDPQMRGMMKQGQERMISRAYETLFSKLKLSEDDSKLVADLLADRNLLAMDNGRKLLNGTPGDEATLAAVKKELEGTKVEYDAKIRGVLGEEKFLEFSSYEQTIGDRRALEFANRNFSRKNAPLEASQKEALLNLMREEREKTPGDIIPDLGGGPGMSLLMNEAELLARQEREKAHHDRVVSRAPSAGLSPDQVTILSESLKQREDWRRFGARNARAFMNGGQ